MHISSTNFECLQRFFNIYSKRIHVEKQLDVTEFQDLSKTCIFSHSEQKYLLSFPEKTKKGKALSDELLRKTQRNKKSGAS
jgi:hypothetical protein